MEAQSDSRWPPGLWRPVPWQMSWSERAAMKGVLAQLRPRLAIEIGTAEGGSLVRVAEHSEEVHALDLVRTEPRCRQRQASHRRQQGGAARPA